MTWSEIRTIILSAMGSALEYYDFTVFVFLAEPISRVFFPADSPEWIRLLNTYAIFALGYFVRPAAGVLIAHFGDKLGRKQMFIFTLFIMAMPTLFIGLLPTYAEIGWVAPGLLLLMRLLQGFALAGELPGAMVFVAEHAQRSRLSFSCSVLQGIIFLGLAIGSSTTGLLSSFLPHPADLYSYGWRLPFILGGVFGLVSVYLRRYLHETPLFIKLKETKEISRKLPLFEVIRSHLGAVIFVAFVSLFINQTTTVMFQYMPTLLVRQYHISPGLVHWTNTAAVLFYAGSCLAWGWLGDRIGRGITVSIGAACTALAAICMFYYLGAVSSGGANLLYLWCAVGLMAGYIGLTPSMASSLFPTSIRLTGFAFPYNLATAIGGGMTPVLVTWLVQSYGRGATIYLAMFACIGFCILGIVYPFMRRFLGDGSSPSAGSLESQLDSQHGSESRAA